MATKITFIYDNPADPKTFETRFAEEHRSLLAALPGVQKMEVSKVHPKEDGSPTPAYRMVDLYFNDYQAACEAVKTPEAAKLFPSVFGMATGGVKILFSEIEA